MDGVKGIRTHWTEKRKRAFIEHLAQTANVARSAMLVGGKRDWVYKLRKKDPEFAEAWDDAIERACDALEEEARRRAIIGVKRLRYYKGEPCGSYLEYSDLLLLALLRAHRPSKFDRRSLEPTLEFGFIEKLKQLGISGPKENDD